MIDALRLWLPLFIVTAIACAGLSLALSQMTRIPLTTYLLCSGGGGLVFFGLVVLAVTKLGGDK